MNTCGECKFWRQAKPPGTIINIRKDGVREGMCRRFPPAFQTVILPTGPRNEPTPMTGSWYPNCNSTDEECGEWRDKNIDSTNPGKGEPAID